jgi:hypothetical protein
MKLTDEQYEQIGRQVGEANVYRLEDVGRAAVDAVTRIAGLTAQERTPAAGPETKACPVYAVPWWSVGATVSDCRHVMRTEPAQPSDPYERVFGIKPAQPTQRDYDIQGPFDIPFDKPAQPAPVCVHGVAANVRCSECDSVPIYNAGRSSTDAELVERMCGAFTKTPGNDMSKCMTAALAVARQHFEREEPKDRVTLEWINDEDGTGWRVLVDGCQQAFAADKAWAELCKEAFIAALDKEASK